MFFSIIIPTKQRHKLLRETLRSIDLQGFTDYEVIVTDDYEISPCKEIVESFSNIRFKYVCPPKRNVFGMCQNWKYGLKNASGDYIIFIQDKMLLKKDALANIYNHIIELGEPDILNWDWDFYYFINEENSFRGIWCKKGNNADILCINIESEIRKRLHFEGLSFMNSQGTPGPGSPLCGAIKKSIYEKVKSEYDDPFNCITPDYGPIIALLYASKNVYYTERCYSIMMLPEKSEGKTHIDYEKTKSFISKSTCGLSRMKYALIPYAYITDTNIVVADYNYFVDVCGLNEQYGKCDEVNAMISLEKNKDKWLFPEESLRSVVNNDIETIKRNWDSKQMTRYLQLNNKKITKSPGVKKHLKIFIEHIPIKLKLRLYNCYFYMMNKPYRFGYFIEPRDCLVK